MLKDVLPADAVGEVVTAPVSPMHGIMTLQDTVAPGHAGAVEAGPYRVVLLQVGLHLNTQQSFKRTIVGRQQQEVVVKRRPARGGHEPVAADHWRIAAS